MPGDYTRDTFNPFRDYLAVLMQQGRVLVDADFNALNSIIDRHFRSETVDIIGRCVVPRETPNGFAIQLTGQSFTIGRGRLYAHGLQAENHGKAPLEFDPILAEQRGTLPMPYDEQPYLPNAAAFSPREGGPHLVYADVWQREVTPIEDPDLVDKAVGVDTATRLQTVWQVKVLAGVGNATCSTPDDQIPGWLDIIRPSAGRLTTGAVGVPSDQDPCVVPISGGFRGTENRLYRVEVHDAGPLSQTTVKWSRDNASIATPVTGINAGRDVLTVSRTGRDSVLRFSPGDWIEVTDDWRELHGQAGEMRKVLLVDDVAQTVTLTAALTAGIFDTAAPASRHTRIRRWDQKGQVLDALNNVVADVDASNGVIPIPAGGTFVLEDGVQVTLSTDPAGGSFRIGDYWVFAARTVDASVEPLLQAPPKGIHHHYCRLAIITFPNSVVDCRTLWPPQFESGGCDCTACVSAEGHNSGAFTIQMAIDRVKATGGKVCLGPGVFILGNTPVQVQGAQSVQIEGKGWRTLLLYTGGGPAIQVQSSVGIDISQVFVYAFSIETASAALAVVNSAMVRVERCLFFQFRRDSNTADACIGIGGAILETAFRDNLLFGGNGIVSLANALDDQPRLVQNRNLTITLGLKIEDNLVLGRRRGVSLDGMTVHVGDTRVSRNSIYGCSEAAIVARGLVALPYVTSSHIDIEGNTLVPSGDGIVAGSDNTRIDGNDIGIIPSTANRAAGGRDGIVLDRSLFKVLGTCRVTGNRVMGLSGNGVLIRAAIGSAMIKNNLIDLTGGGGIVMEERAAADNLSIENNQLLRVAFATNDTQTQLTCIRALRCRQLEIAGNSIDRFAQLSVQNPVRYAIEVFACPSTRIAGNDLTNIGPPGAFVKAGAGVYLQAPFDRVDIVDNSIRRNSTLGAAPDNSVWSAVIISGAVAGAAAAFQQRSTVFPFVAAIGGEFFAVGTNVLAVLPLGKEIVGVRGNLLEAYGLGRTVDATVSGAAVFSDNRCTLAQATATAGVPVVELRAGAAVLNANFLQRTPSNDAFVGLMVTTGNGPFTLLGNISMGGVYRINGGGPGAPWDPLNVMRF